MAENKPLKQFPMPDAVAGEEDGFAVISAWLVKGQLQIAAQRTFEKPEMWGNLLVDIAKHASNIYAQQGVMTQREAMGRILGVLSRHTGGGMDSGQTTII